MLPCRRDKCIGRACGNFNDPTSKLGKPNLPAGCKGGEFPPWEWARWYIDDLPKCFADKRAMETKQ